MEKLRIYTDGGCRPNPGKGAWAAVLLRNGMEAEELVGTEEETTNNRMELRAAIEALNALGEKSEVDLHTDSEYLRMGVTQWMAGWKKKGWRTASGSPVRNVDLWKALDAAIGKHEIRWHWVRGHSGDRWNERVDRMASEAIGGGSGLVEDQGAAHVILGIAYQGKRQRGAWAALLRFGEHERELKGVEEQSSPNRLHILGALRALEAFKRPVRAHIYTASDYLKDGATTWIRGWKQRGWKTRDGRAVSHQDAWMLLDSLMSRHQLTWHVLSSEEKLEELEGVRRLARAALDEEDRD